MFKSYTATLALMLAGSAASLPARAHHSFSMFDPGKIVTLDATLYKTEWINPHSWIWVTVKNASGGMYVWAIQGVAPAKFGRMGMTKSDFTTGLKLKLDIHPLRNGQMGGQFLRATLPDGRVIGSLKTPVDILRESGVAK